MRSATLSATAVLASVAAAQLDKPVIDPPFPDGGLDSLSPGIWDNGPRNAGAVTKWEDGKIAEDCKTMAEGAEFSAADIETYDVKYDNCEQPWVMCRHKDSPMAIETIAERLGTMPVRFRSFVRHMLFVPGNPSAGSNGDNVVMNGDLPVSVFAHEIGHSLDGHGWEDTLGGGMSVNQVWLDAYNADSAVPDSYAQSSQAENFAQNTVVAMYDLFTNGGLSGIQPNFQAIQNQYELVKRYTTTEKDIMGFDGQCGERLENSPAVDINSKKSVSTESKAKSTPVPKGIKTIPRVEMSDKFEMHDYKNGKVINHRSVNLHKKSAMPWSA